MMNRPEKEHTPLEGMDNEQIHRFALFLFEENQSKSKQLDEMIACLLYTSGVSIKYCIRLNKSNAFTAYVWSPDAICLLYTSTHVLLYFFAPTYRIRFHQ